MGSIGGLVSRDSSQELAIGDAVGLRGESGCQEKRGGGGHRACAGLFQTFRHAMDHASIIKIPVRQSFG